MTENRQPRNWKKSITIALAVIVAIGGAYVIGAFFVGPSGVRAPGGVISTAVLDMPSGILPATDIDGNAVTLLVKIAETTEARKAGLSNVGAKALDTTVLLYAHPRLQTSRVTYTMTGIRAPLELAVIDETGNVVAIKKASITTSSISVTEKHQWILAAKEGLLAKLGIAQGSVVTPGDIRRIS
ncbi:DUF192 domain-containing protein [Candidatus Bipolaricaulota bacterium]|nr:DUF192 domain-containing protein [Candidatus Bipolaricaulota bacterium]